MTRVRKAGRGRQPDGTLVIWSLSDGTRGRRSREVRVSPDGGIVGSLLLETDPERRFSHMELSTSAGLLTLHPEDDGTLHGNAIRAGGIEHIAGLPWTTSGLLLVDGSPVASATAAWFVQDQPVPLRSDWHAVTIDVELRWRVERRLPAEIAANHDALERLDDAADWPLELR